MAKHWDSFLSYCIFHPPVILIRNHFSVHTSTYSSIGHLKVQYPAPLHTPGCTPILDVSHQASNQSTISPQHL